MTGMTVEHPAVESDPILGPEEGGGPPVGSPWTLVVDGDEAWEADLEHAAPLPRVGERIEFIGEDGRRHEYRVVDVIHTVQTSADERPRVRDESSLPNSFVTDGADDVPPRSLRAGLPKVVVRAGP
jgi:hypothetical protein